MRPVLSIGPCEVCRRWTRGGLCAGCIGRHAAATWRCRGCALSLPDDRALCGRCLREAPPQSRCIAAVDYGFPWDALLASFKYQGRAELAAVLAPRLHAALPDDEAGWPEVVLPIPLAPARLAERGYNQAWELARRVARRCRRPAHAGALQRPLDGRHQADLGRTERLRALRGAFWVAEPQRVRGRRVALVDDVLTTGATAAAATRALLDAGAAEVHVWVLARTP